MVWANSYDVVISSFYCIVWIIKRQYLQCIDVGLGAKNNGWGRGDTDFAHLKYFPACWPRRLLTLMNSSGWEGSPSAANWRNWWPFFGRKGKPARFRPRLPGGVTLPEFATRLVWRAVHKRRFVALSHPDAKTQLICHQAANRTAANTGAIIDLSSFRKNCIELSFIKAQVIFYKCTANLLPVPKMTAQLVTKFAFQMAFSLPIYNHHSSATTTTNTC